MAFSYSGDPEESAKDQVRFLIGDTDQHEPLLQDGEIYYLLRRYNNYPLNTAIRACETIMAKFARLCDESVGQVRLTLSQRYKGYAETRAMLQQRVAIEGATPYAGGISKSDVQQVDQNRDRVRPDFTKHMMENQDIAPWVTAGELLGDPSIEEEA